MFVTRLTFCAWAVTNTAKNRTMMTVVAVARALTFDTVNLLSTEN